MGEGDGEDDAVEKEFVKDAAEHCAKTGQSMTSYMMKHHDAAVEEAYQRKQGLKKMKRFAKLLFDPIMRVKKRAVEAWQANADPDWWVTWHEHTPDEWVCEKLT